MSNESQTEPAPESSGNEAVSNEQHTEPSPEPSDNGAVSNEQSGLLPVEFREFLGEPAPETSEQFDAAFDEALRARDIKRKIEELHTATAEVDNLTKIGVLEREVAAIREWGDGQREYPTTGHPLLEVYNLQSIFPFPPELATDLDTAGQKKQGPAGVVVCPAGTEWHDITFRFEDFDKISIIFAKRTVARSFRSFAFSFNSKNQQPTKLWLHLLNLAVHKGSPPREPDNKKQITIKIVSDIRRGLKKIFPGIDGEPIGIYSKAIKGWPLTLHLCVAERVLNQDR